MTPTRLDTLLTHTAGVGVFLTFALTFGLQSGYSYGAALLLLASLVFLVTQRGVTLDKQDQALCWVFILYFAAHLGTVLYHGHRLSQADEAARCVLAIPILAYLRHRDLKVCHMWAGVVVGALLSVGIAAWQLYVLELDRAEGYLNIIHFGNIALVYAAFCMAGLVWALRYQPPNRAWQIALAIGLICSLYSVNASGSRASWVAIPPVVILFLAAFVDRRNARWAVGASVVAVAVVAVLFTMPDSRLKARYDAAVSDIVLLMEQNEADTSLGARVVMWQAALLNIPKHPVLGWSQDEYTAELEAMAADGRIDAVALKYQDNLHNNYLHAWVFNGIFGLLALLALYFVPLVLFLRRLRARDMATRIYSFCGSALCASYVCFSLTQAVLRRNNGMMFLLLALIILWALMRQAETRAILGRDRSQRDQKYAG